MAANGHANGANGTTSISSIEDFISQPFDYLICGGGTAGLVVAARLSENPDVTVGVIEAGKWRKDDMNVDVPALFLQMLGNKEYDWVHQTVPQKGDSNKVHHIPRGKLLGGSSGINYMMYVRGSSADYDDWAELADDPSWGSKEMNGYMRKHQTLEPIDAGIKDTTSYPHVGEHHGTSGPVKTSFNPWALPLEDDFIKAADDATGFSKKPTDPWSGDHIGFYNTLGAVVRSGPDKGKRSYAARGYYQANEARPNLKVICESLVNKVIMEGNRATGVSFSHDGSTHEVKAKREVIVSGGTIKTPQILELSGVGDPEVLRKAGVELKVENKAVGAHVQDHVVAGLAYMMQPGEMTLDSIAIPEVLAAAQKELMENQSGPLTCISGVQGFFPYKLMATPEELKECVDSIRNTPARNDFERKQFDQIIAHLENDKSANLQMVLVAAMGDFKEGTADQSKLFPLKLNDKGEAGFTLALCLQYPVSRGTIHISSSDPTADPVIDPGYMNHPADKHVLAMGIKMADRMAKSKHLSSKLSTRMLPSNPKLDLQNTKDAEATVEEWIMGEYHICSSVPMGAALDNHLRVRGAEGLRVVDASAFPNNVSGNIASSVYALAEKAADIIKHDANTAALGVKAN